MPERPLSTWKTFTDLEHLVEKQAEDTGLWFVAETAPEAYLQQELRRLHVAVEGLSQAVRLYESLSRISNAMVKSIAQDRGISIEEAERLVSSP